ncbi:internal scaffolding protein [Dipodfec virus UOA04_Rod_861]|nr:internal scaffolding protein [Dipodfec virus UOA04_Rod_861]
MTKFKRNYEPFDKSSFAFVSTEPSMTQQAPAEACDINNIIAKYHDTGFLPPAYGTPLFGDFSDLSGGLHAVLKQQEAARELFYELPSQVREKLNNDPMELLERSYDADWCNTTGVEIGLFQKPEPAPDAPVNRVMPSPVDQSAEPTK